MQKVVGSSPISRFDEVPRAHRFGAFQLALDIELGGLFSLGCLSGKYA